MLENFVLLTKVSNYQTPMGAFVSIQVTMWIAVAAQIFLLVPDMVSVIKTKDTRENKGFKGIIGFLCSAMGIAYSVLLLGEDIQVEEIVGLAVAEGVNLICLFIIYGIKIYNIAMAKKGNLTEKQGCSLLRTLHMAKKTLSKKTLKRLKKSCKNLSTKEKIDLYVHALKHYNVARDVKKSIKVTAKKVAKKVIKNAKKNNK